MLQVKNNEEKALSVIVPYLLQFPELYGLAKNSGTRYQNIEDIAWELLYNLDIDSANGVWLDYLGRKVGQSRTYAPVVEGAFTFGGTTSEGFGRGKFQSSALTGPNTKIARSDANFKNAIRAKIIENNTDCSIGQLIQACKLLYNASLVSVTENYPAGISSIYLYGKYLVESSNANTEIKRIMPAGVSLDHVYFYNLYNLFKNNAFISYDTLIPSSDDFILSFSFVPDTLTSGNIPLLSEATSFSQEPIVKMYYNNTDGIVFASSPDFYIDELSLPYVDELGNYYYSNAGSIYLSGGSVNLSEINTVRVEKVGTTHKLYVNDILVDTVTSSVNIGGTSSHNLYLGALKSSFFNSGSIYNLYIQNTTNSSIILNDNLKSTTIGTNSGVRFL